MAAIIDMSLVWEQEICIYPVPIIQITVRLRSLPGKIWALMAPFLELSLETMSWYLPVCSFQNAKPAVSGSIIPRHPTPR